MKPQELTIGSYIKIGTQVGKVVRLDNTTVTIGAYTTAPIETAKPVKLTEKILLANGFNKDIKFKEIFYKRPTENAGALVLIKGAEGGMAWSVMMLHSGIHTIYYVHQLQNVITMLDLPFEIKIQ